MKTLVVKRVGVLSFAGMACGAGLIFGAVLGLFALFMTGRLTHAPNLLPLLFSTLIVMPGMYALGGFIAGLLWGALYNIAAGMLGGLEIVVSDSYLEKMRNRPDSVGEIAIPNIMK
jgi:hypothetical protein